jgi:GH43 family beta-xylosidase
MKNSEIHIRDPFILPYQGKYYLYGTRCIGGRGLGFDCYVGTDLENWSDPIEVFHQPEYFWADRNYWAPEVHYYNNEFYLFASFKSELKCRGTQILKAKNCSPIGPFELHSDGPITPKDWECLDGTFYIDKNGKPYMVFCHEWLQVHDGEICAVELTKDLKAGVGEPKLLFKASQAPWITSFTKEKGDLVTDGPFLYRCKDGTLLMLWSSFGAEGYTEAIAISDNGDILGNWKQDERLLFSKDGGHGMLFTGFDGKLYLSLHSPNKSMQERPKFIEIEDRDGSLYVK